MVVGENPCYLPLTPLCSSLWSQSELQHVLIPQGMELLPCDWLIHMAHRGRLHDPSCLIFHDSQLGKASISQHQFRTVSRVFEGDRPDLSLTETNMLGRFEPNVDAVEFCELIEMC
ncbi:hypothetical protein XENORESO_005970 [Xenotaenia resolanae]|uniref:Uncharacterized protein n=1 Tax=Xenotaenia resolanae TaxID=208358 RepID=A0ABV0VRY5_9TELE